MKRLLLAIDLQNDFCDPAGALYVQGADEDLARTLLLLENSEAHFHSILLSMDSHLPIHIAHPAYWRNAEGEMPAPFTTITTESVSQGLWKAQYYPKESLAYLEALEATDFQCTIWPPHCLIGTKGWALPDSLYQVLSHWSLTQGRNFKLYEKGTHPFTEHYSIFQAATPLPSAPETCFNQSLVEYLTDFDEIIVVGQAMDFCVASSIADLIAQAPSLLSRVTILEDCMSNIIPENPTATAIYQQAQNLGAKVSNSQQFLQGLLSA